MNKLAVIALLLAVFLTGCETIPTNDRGSSQQQEKVLTPNRGIDRLLLEAGRTVPPRSTELRLEAAELASQSGDPELLRRILSSIESPYATNSTTRDYSFLAAELALYDDDPRLAVKILDDRRMQDIRLETDTQISAGRLRAKAYKLGRSYLASARELIYINQLLPPEERQKNHEEIFSTLLMLDEETLQQQAEQSITSEIRGWLSLAALTRRYQNDPLRQLNALKKWKTAWPNHSAAIEVPASLQMLSKIVADRPEHIALLLPLKGSLGGIGRAIRDGYIAAHYQLTPDSSLKIYDSSQGDILETLANAINDGAEIIIGPLDREKVSLVARQTLSVPVIALNRTVEGEINPNLYQFGLAPEDESIQVADQLVREGHLSGLVIAPDTQWGDRNYQAFAERYTELGGVIVDTSRYANQRDYSDMVKSLLNVDSSEERAANLRRITGERFEFSARRRQDIDFVFLLANTIQARGIKPTLAFFYAEDIPVYATSHVHAASDSRVDALDLNGIRFCDIPWKLTAGDDVQQLINATWDSASSQLAPFYALGVDVHRLYPRLQQLKDYPNERVFGSTGMLTLDEDNVITRTLMWAQFQEGEVRAVPMIFGL
ncbi:MAG: penicillin-binding protein activator [Pseudomonadales bacterium]|nr:penicillin-binding protein activator [Pseudomonadales bacterium]MBO7004930.1 penicillin-binding protein activator [Pseudomonadales bacterium]